MHETSDLISVKMRKIKEICFFLPFPVDLYITRGDCEVITIRSDFNYFNKYKYTFYETFESCIQHEIGIFCSDWVVFIRKSDSKGSD